MPEEDVQNFIDMMKRRDVGQTNDPGAIPQPAGPDLNAGATRRGLGVPPTANRPQPPDFVSRNFRGLPIDLDLESATGVKTALIARERPEDKIAYLEGLAGKGNVRLADDGQPLVTVWDEKRKSPVEFRPLGGGPNIIATAQALAPETVGAIAGMAVGRAVPTTSRFLKFGAEMIGAAVGEQAGGAAKDVTVSSTPLDEIVSERASRVPTSAAVNTAFGGAAALAGKVAGPVVSPFGGVRGEIEKGTAEAIEYFSKKFDINYPLSAGEQIDSPLFKRVEATMSRSPGASANFAKIQREKVEALRQIQAKMLSSKLDPADMGMLRKLEEDVGEEAINAVRQNLHPLQQAEEMARSNTALAANDAIMDEFAKAVGPARQLYPHTVGAKMRAGAFSRREAFETESGRLYDEVYRLPGGTDKIIEPPNLVSDAKKLLKEQPAPEVTTATPTGLVNPQGQPIVSVQTEREVLREFVPEGIVPMLTQLSQLGRGQAKFSLQDLVKMRTEVRNSIKRGESVPGVNTHYLGEIEGLLTKSINEGTAALPTPELRDAWMKANNFYAQNVGKFKDKDVARLFRDNETGAFVQNEDLVRNIGPTEYKTFKEFFGPTSPEFTALKRSLVDTILPNEGELINAKNFLGKLYDFTHGKNLAVAEDILGPETTKRLERISGLMKNVQDGDVVARDDIVNILVGANQNKLLSQLDQLVASQRELSKAYKSSIVRDIGEKKLGETFDGTEFVNRLWDDASPKEIKAIKEGLSGSPKILEDLERKAAERVFQDSQRAASGFEPSRVAIGEPFRKGSASSIERVFGSEQNKLRLQELLGEEKMKDFEQLAKLLKGGEASESAFAGAGGLAAQQQIIGMYRQGLFSYLPQWAEQKLVATLYFLPPVRKLLTNQIGRSPEVQANLVRAAVLSQPFLDAMGADFGDKAGAFIDKVLDSIDLYQVQGRAGKAAVSRQDWVDRLIGQPIDPNRQRVFPIPQSGADEFVNRMKTNTTAAPVTP